MRVETDLHEWIADGISYEFLPDEIAEESYRSLTENHGHHPEGTQCLWESADQMKERVMGVLSRYRNHNAVIVVCHGTLINMFWEWNIQKMVRFKNLFFDTTSHIINWENQ